MPVIPVQNNTDNVYANLLLQRSCYNGSGEDDEANLTGHQKLQRQVDSRMGRKDVPYILIDYNTPDGRTESFEFGALCIVESMAYIMETECYPNAPPSPDLPYRAAEKLVELIYPELGADRLNVLALCDASLAAFHPGQIFYDVLLTIRNQPALVNSPEDIYSLVASVAINYNGRPMTIAQLFDPVGSKAVNQMVGYFHDINLDPVRDWLRDLVSMGIRYRRANPTFPLNIARGGHMTQNRAFADYMSNVGTPLITNACGEVSIADPRAVRTPPNYGVIWAINQIYDVLMGYQRNCELVDFCRQGGIHTDNHCTNSPWNKTSQASCAFGQMWRHWALTNYYPNIP